MPIESPFTHITDLNASNPLVGDPVSQGDDHIRGLKTVLLTDFANINAAVTTTPAELNVNTGVTGGTVTASKTVVVDASKDIGTFGQVTAATFTGTNVDGILGANTPAAIIGTTVVANTSIDINGTVVVVGTIDDDTMAAATDTTLATSESIKAYIDSVSAIPVRSNQAAYTGAGSYTVNHSLGRVPVSAIIQMEARSTSQGYSIGEIIFPCQGNAGSTSNALSCGEATSTQITIRTAFSIMIPNGTTNAAVASGTTSDWYLAAVVV